jgi:uncharacterized protein (TIGR03435 family)
MQTDAGQKRALPIHAGGPIVNAMHMPRPMAAVAFLCSIALAQPAAKSPGFDVASVRPSRVTVGPDYNNQITFTRDGFSAKNVTLGRLIAEAWKVQLNQVAGPGWIEHSEYDISARAAEGTTKEQMAPLIKKLLVERFQLRDHTETRKMRVYELAIAKSGLKIRPTTDDEPVKTAPGFHFHGDMRQFADLLAVQFSIPAPVDPSVPARAGGPPILVVDKTGLDGIFDFSLDMQPELNTDRFTAWQRALEDQLGLRIDSQKEEATVVVVDNAVKIPIEN